MSSANYVAYGQATPAPMPAVGRPRSGDPLTQPRIESEAAGSIHCFKEFSLPIFGLVGSFLGKNAFVCRGVDRYFSEKIITPYTHFHVSLSSCKSSAKLIELLINIQMPTKTKAGTTEGGKVTSLDLSKHGTQFTEEESEVIFKLCPNIHTLNLSGCSGLTLFSGINMPGTPNFGIPFSFVPLKLSDHCLTTLAKQCKSLRTLYLSDCKQLTGTGVILLARECQNFETLDLSECTGLMMRPSLVMLARECPTLRILYLKRCSQLTDDDLTAFAEERPKLRALYLNGCSRLTGQGIIELVKECPELGTLDLSECREITSANLAEIFKHCPNLHTLYISGCRHLNDFCLETLFQHSPNLGALDISGSTSLTANCLATHAKKCSNLHTLNLSYYEHLSDASIVAIAKECQKLHTLYLTGCAHLTGISLTALETQCRNLRALDVARCAGLQNDIDRIFDPYRKMAGLCGQKGRELLEKRRMQKQVQRDLEDEQTKEALQECLAFKTPQMETMFSEEAQIQWAMDQSREEERMRRIIQQGVDAFTQRASETKSDD